MHKYEIPEIYSDGDGHVAVPNLAALHRGVPLHAAYVHMETIGAFTVATGALHGVTMARPGATSLDLTEDQNVRLVVDALRATPPARRRHAAGANAQRTAAGQIALRVRDVEVRTKLLDAVDGWGALRDSSIHTSPRGELCAIPGVDLVRVVIVRCPSTSRVYGLTVPASCETVEAALNFLNKGEVDVET